MDSTDLAHIERRARVRYEVARTRRALLGISPLLIVVAVGACVTHRPFSTLWFGLAALVAGALMLWSGRDAQRAVLPGIAAGLVPMVLAICANHMHMCGPDGCGTLCVQACMLGGAIAGLAVAGIGNQRRAGVWFWVSASGLALLTGAMGCSCVGYTGIIGLGVGFAAGMVPALMGRALRKDGT